MLEQGLMYFLAERVVAEKRTGLVCVRLELQECILEYLSYVSDVRMMS